MPHLSLPSSLRVVAAPEQKKSGLEEEVIGALLYDLITIEAAANIWGKLLLSRGILYWILTFVKKISFVILWTKWLKN